MLSLFRRIYPEPLHSYSAKSSRGPSFKLTDIWDTKRNLADVVYHIPMKTSKRLKIERVVKPPKEPLIPPVPINVIPGCEFDSKGMNEMIELFPSANISDLQRFLIARNADVLAASEMYSAAEKWRIENLPATRAFVEAAMSTKSSNPLHTAQ